MDVICRGVAPAAKPFGLRFAPNEAELPVDTELKQDLDRAFLLFTTPFTG